MSNHDKPLFEQLYVGIRYAGIDTLANSIDSAAPIDAGSQDGQRISFFTLKAQSTQ